MTPPIITIYTDGGCDPNPGRGGWAALIQQDGKTTELSGCDHGIDGGHPRTQCAQGTFKGRSAHRFDLLAEGYHRMDARLVEEKLARQQRTGVEPGSMERIIGSRQTAPGQLDVGKGAFGQPLQCARGCTGAPGEKQALTCYG
jgi:hypothetical protein